MTIDARHDPDPGIATYVDAESAVVGADLDWKVFAPVAGGVGRWVWNMSNGLVELDDVSRDMLGLDITGGIMTINDFFAHVHPDDVATVQTQADAARGGNQRYRAEFRMIKADGETVWVEGTGTYETTKGGDEILVGTNVDISEHRRAHERQELLASEMAHRTGNLLSLTSGLFRLAARRSDDVPSLEAAFLSRLEALSKVTRLSTQTIAQDVSTGELVSIVLEGLVESGQVTLKVDEVRMNSAAAQTVTLAINELMTNAVKYGALSVPEGRVHVAISTDRATDNFRLVWDEATPFTVNAPQDSKGFGMTVLRRMTAATFRGEPEIRWRESGMYFHCDWSLQAMT